MVCLWTIRTIWSWRLLCRSTGAAFQQGSPKPAWDAQHSRGPGTFGTGGVAATPNEKTSFIYHEEVAKILFNLLNKKGVINVGGKSQTIYDFAKKDNNKIKKIYLKKNSNSIMPFNSSMNLSKLKKNIKKK